jgi:hypothetical protein
VAQKTVVTTLCDLDTEETEAADLVKFGLEGSYYELDVCVSHAIEVRKELGRFADHARRIKGPRPPRNRAHLNGAKLPPDNAAVRAWAKQNNRKVAERGRIAVAVLRDYEAAIEAPPPPAARGAAPARFRAPARATPTRAARRT